MEIVAENIRAMQAVYGAAMLEEMRVFGVADRVVEQFHTGLLPLGRGPAGERLYQYWTGRSARLTGAERRQLYRRALGLGPGADTDPTANRKFEDLWLRFVSSVSQLARQTEVDALDLARRARRDLVENLSLHGWGGISYAATRLASEVRDAVDLLSEPEIGSAYGARDMWQVVDRVSTLYLGAVPDLRRRRSRLDAARRMFQWLADSAAATEPDVSDPALVNALEEWLTVGGETERPWRPRDRDIVAEVSSQVQALLARAQAASQLPPATRARMTRDAIRIGTTVVRVRLVPAVSGALISQVNFPQFVAGLVEGVFHAIVDASERQMEAYAELVASVASSVDRFVAAARRRRERDWLATMAETLLAGATHIAVSDGRVKPCLHLGRKPRRRRGTAARAAVRARRRVE
jgi:hypothetical protein